MPITSASASSDVLQNHIKLQKLCIDLVESMNTLSKKMERMLSLFEEAAKNIEQTESGGSLEKKLEALLEQNKIIARGLVLIERYIRDKTTTGFKASALDVNQGL